MIVSLILITLMLKEMGIPVVVAKAQSLQHGKVLEKIGADKIIYPEQDMGIRLAHNLIRSNVMDFIELSHILVAPGAEDIIEENDILVIVASKKALSKLPE